MWWFSCFKSITGRHPSDALRTLNRTLECLEIFLRMCYSEALGKFALAFPESSVTLQEIVFPRESEEEGVDSY